MRRLCWWVLALLAVSQHVAAHDITNFSAASVNPPILELDRSIAKFDFLARQAGPTGNAREQVEAARAIVYANFLWQQSVLKICFWNGDEATQRDIIQVASVWQDAIRIIRFDFEENDRVRLCRIEDQSNSRRRSDIRITLDNTDPRPLWNPQDVRNKGGDWSYPGRAVASNAAYPTTMSLVRAAQYRRLQMMAEYYFNVRHEFGHALGLAHEHQRDLCKGWFNIRAIAEDTGWTEKEAEAQVGALPTNTNFRAISLYDRNSIMQYNFALRWYEPDRPGMSNPCRRDRNVDDLSETDQIAIAELYAPSLNESPERQAIIEQQKRQWESLMPAGAAPVATHAGSIQVALASIGQGQRLSGGVTLQLFLKPQDRLQVTRAVANLGFPLQDQAGRSIVTVGVSNPTLTGDPTNAVIYTADVPEQDVRYVALSLIEAGIEIKSVEPYVRTRNNNYRSRARLIQIGSNIVNRGQPALTREQILSAPLPLFSGQRR